MAWTLASGCGRRQGALRIPTQIANTFRNIGEAMPMPWHGRRASTLPDRNSGDLEKYNAIQLVLAAVPW